MHGISAGTRPTGQAAAFSEHLPFSVMALSGDVLGNSASKMCAAALV
jgi:hypothetical protein